VLPLSVIAVKRWNRDKLKREHMRLFGLFQSWSRLFGKPVVQCSLSKHFIALWTREVFGVSWHILIFPVSFVYHNWTQCLNYQSEVLILPSQWQDMPQPPCDAILQRRTSCLYLSPQEAPKLVSLSWSGPLKHHIALFNIPFPKVPLHLQIKHWMGFLSLSIVYTSGTWHQI
jgi:hypothetical protein